LESEIKKKNIKSSQNFIIFTRWEELIWEFKSLINNISLDLYIYIWEKKIEKMNNMNYPSIYAWAVIVGIIYMCPLACRQEHWDRQELYTYVRLSITQFSISMQVVSSTSLKSFSRVWAKLHLQEAKKLYITGPSHFAPFGATWAWTIYET
jgi:hypothetical protein